jgi:hypothetical protein
LDGVLEQLLFFLLRAGVVDGCSLATGGAEGTASSMGVAWFAAAGFCG